MDRKEFDSTFFYKKLTDIISEKKGSNRATKAFLEPFLCSINQDLQEFLHNKAIRFEQNLLAKTYVYFKNDDSTTIVAYFSITIKSLLTDGLATSIKKLLDGHKGEMPAVPCYLIGQLGIADNFRSLKLGEHLLEDAINIITNAQSQLGGRFVLLDAVNNESVLRFYKKNMFLPIEPIDVSKESIKMIKPFFN